MKAKFYQFILFCCLMLGFTTVQADYAFVTDYVDQKVYGFDTANLSTPATLLISSQISGYGITLSPDGSTGYIAALTGDVYTFPTSGPYAETPLGTGLTSADGIAISSDGTTGFVTQTGSGAGIYSFPTAGSSHTPTLLTNSGPIISNPAAIYINGSTVYVSSSLDEESYTFPENSTSYNATVFQPEDCGGFVISKDNYIYFTVGRSALRVPLASPQSNPVTLTTLPNGTNLGGIAVSTDNNTLFMASNTGLYTIPTNAGFPQTATSLSALNIPSAQGIVISNIPTITAISPTSGLMSGGTSVTITGFNFTGATSVKFGTVSASFTVVSDTQITATAPAGTVGTVNITVTTPNGTSPVTTNDQFSYIPPPPQLSETYFPSSGTSQGGTTVNLVGENLLYTTSISFGSTPAPSFTVQGNSQVSVISPPGTGNVLITLTTPGGSATVPYTYISSPTVTGLNPSSGPLTGGNRVIITGTGLLSAVIVLFGSTDGTSIDYISDTEISVLAPAGTGTVDVTVRNSLGMTSPTNPSDRYTYESSPTVTSVSPTTGLTTGGLSVTITGTNFTDTTAVKFGTVGASFVVNSSTQITATSPPNSAGVVDITVTTPSGTSATSTNDQFTYTAPPGPVVTGLSPSSGPTAGGTIVTITGTSFTGTTAVNFGTIPATNITINSDTQLTVTSPASSAGSVNVTVTTPNGTSTTSSADLFTYYAPPTVTSLSPTGGPVNTGTTVVITGTNLTGATSVKFGTTSATFTVNSATQITATSPSESAGTVNVTVTTPGGTSATSAADQYTYYNPPTVTNVLPSEVPAQGGTPITITGTNFTGATTVDFGTVSTSFVIVSPTEITTTAPAEMSGTVFVTVTTPGGTSATGSGSSFTFVAVPTVTSVSPNAGPTAGGNSVVITGTNLSTVATVKFGTASALFTVNSNTQITATAPAGSPQTVDITVSSVGGTSATSPADQYTYYVLPTVTSITPTQGPTSGGTSVTITGTNFTGATLVQFGSNSASYTVNSPTQITAVSPAVGGFESEYVYVTTPGGTSATNPNAFFTYFLEPIITSVNPNVGPTTGGTTVVITGENFLEPIESVLFGTVSAFFTLNSNTQITATAPAGSAGTVNITVTNPGGTSAITSNDDFTYEVVTEPVVTGISPNTGPSTGGTSIVITGMNFTGATAVDFGTNAATFTVNSSTQITATSPSGSVGTVDVTVTSSAGTSATSPNDQFTYTAVPAPTITGASPNTGPITGGTSVVISGTNFTGATAVVFGTTPATSFTVNSATQITAISPAEVAGTVDIRVTTPSGTSRTTFSDQYTYTNIQEPSITGLSPSFGPTTGGTVVVITGSNFTGTQDVLFGSALATFTVNSATQITVTSPANTAGVVDVTVTTSAGTSAITPNDEFTYFAPPTITNVTPNSGSVTGGTSVTITGTNLSTATAVFFGTTSATSFSVISPTEINAVSPAESAGTVNVTVQTDGGTSATSANDQFTYIGSAAPTVTAVSPNSGKALGGTTVTITGTGFTGASTVNFGSTSASFVVNSPTQITATSPAGSGSVNITVTTAAGTSITSESDLFTYIPAPVITAVSPSSGPTSGGTIVTISGLNFTDATVVSFGTTSATFTLNSANQITATSPAGSNIVDITVQTPGGTSAISVNDQFTYVPLPTVTALSPNQGAVTGGTSVTITGTNFTGATAVNFGSVGATYTVNSATQITATAPAGQAVGTVDVTIVSAGGTSAITPNDHFTYLEVTPVPTVTALSPTAGPANQESVVVITGTHLTGATSVLFGTTLASFTVNSDTQITATAPSENVGTVNVTVTTPGGTSASSPNDEFTYAALPIISSITPNMVPTTASSSDVNISGSNFTGASAVSFGSTPAISFTVVSSSLITATAPTGAAGTVNVRVTTPGGTSAITPSDQFTYVAPPAITGVSPNQGSVAGGITVTITGSNFTDTSAVFFGTTDATNFTILSSTEIRATVPQGNAGVVDVRVVTPVGGVSPITATDEFTYVAQPVISSVNPNEGPPSGGTNVTITGSSFTGTTAVTFGTTAAIVFTVLSDTQITATAPPGSVGIVDVRVTTAVGTSAITPNDHFDYVLLPIVSSLSPNAGPVGGGTNVAITGSNFINVTAVNFGATPATSFTVVSPTEITALSPAGSAGSVNVTVVNTSGTSTITQNDLFTYAAAPSVSSLSPNQGPLTGGTNVTITGTNLIDASAVNFGTTAALSFTIISANEVIATSPAGAAGAVDVTVTTPGGTSPTSVNDRFTYVPLPMISTLSPNQGSVLGGTSVTINGSNFAGTTAVSFGSNPATNFTVISSTQIVATSPPGAAGMVDVRVTTAGGTSAITPSDGFTYLSLPVVSSVSPNEGSLSGGTTVTIMGANFVNMSAVNFGTTPATMFTVVSANEIIATAPAAIIAGSVDVTITTLGGVSLISPNDEFTYVSAPSVATLNPSIGLTTGGTIVTITGSNLSGATAVNFGTTAATFSVVSNTEITAASPPGALGSVDVTVETIGGTSATNPGDLFTYQNEVFLPTVTSVLPSSGPTTGGNNVVITGTNFTGAIDVNFGSAAATFTVNSDTQITAIAPDPAPGTVNVTVTTPYGTSAITPDDEYTFVAAPIVDILSPTTGPITGGTIVTLTGSSLTGATAVNFGLVAATFTVDSDSQITAISPAGAAGTVDVTVVSAGGTSAITTGDRFTYTSMTMLFPPRHVRGCQIKKCECNHLKITNLLTWLAPLRGETPVAYKIYRDAALTDLAGTVEAHYGEEPFKFLDSNRKKYHVYTYYIVSVDALGHESKATKVVVKHACKRSG